MRGKLENNNIDTNYINELYESVKRGLVNNGYLYTKFVIDGDRLNIYPAKDNILDDEYGIIQKYANQVREKNLRTGHTWLKVEDGHLFIQVW